MSQARLAPRRIRTPLSAIGIVGILACGSATQPGNTPPPGPVVAALVVNPDSVNLDEGATQQLVATALDSAGNQVTGVAVTFTTKDTSILGVTPGGLVTGRRIGAGAVTATAAPVSKRVPVVVREAIATNRTAVAVSGRPFGAAVSATGVVYATRQDADSLARVDLPTLAVTGGVPVGRDPGDVAFSPSGTVAYVTNFLAQSVGFVNVATGTQTATVPTPGNAYRLLLSANGSTLYVSAEASVVLVIDAATRAVLDTIPVGGAPNGIARHPNGTLLYVSAAGAGTVTEINTGTNTVVRTIPVGGVPQDIAVSPDGAELYVADETGNVGVVTLSSGAVALIPLGGGGFGLGLSPGGSYLYVTLPAAGLVKVVDRVERAVVRTVSVGGTPRRVAFHAPSRTVVVPNEGGWVDFIRP